MSSHPIVVAGGGLAAQRCCERLRRAGWQGGLVMVCEEPVAPYDRPPLSKQFLSGKMTAPPRLRPDQWYADNDVELVLARRATRLVAGEHVLELTAGERLRYSRLLIATGAIPRRLPGFDGFGNVHVLRTIGDAEVLRDRLGPAVRLAVVGAGFIGQEVAATARSLGAEVTLIEALPAPLATLLGEQVGGWFAELHRSHGVAVHVGAAVDGVSGNGRLQQIRLANGRSIPCDEVVLGVGVAPATAWLAGSGLDPAGIRTDSAGRTALPDVFAAGDCTRSQHWEAAAQQGAAAALAMLGDSPGPRQAASFWSDLYGLRVNWLGEAQGAQEIAIEGDPDEREFTVLYRRDGSVVGGLLIGRPHELPALRQLLTHAQRKEGP